ETALAVRSRGYAGLATSSLLRGRPARLVEKGGAVFSLGFTPDGSRLLAADGAAVVVWDVAASRAIARLEGHEREVRQLRISPDGKQVLTAAIDRTARLWELGSAASRKIFTGPRLSPELVAFWPEGLLVGPP